MKQVRAASLRVNTKPHGFVVASWSQTLQTELLILTTFLSGGFYAVCPEPDDVVRVLAANGGSSFG